MSEKFQSGRRNVSFRMFRIDQLIKTGKYMSIKDLAESLEVSPRTIQRDLDAMRDLMGAPLAYDHFRRGFFYEREFSLPRPNLTEGELVALFLTEKLTTYLEGTPYAAQLASAGAKLRLLMTDYSHYKPEMDAGYISIANEPLRGEEMALAENFARLETARRQNRRVEIAHFSVQRGQETLRLLDPYHLYLRRGIWYVIGFCHLRHEVRIFALDRINTVRITAAKFDIVNGFNVEVYLKGCWGIERGNPARVKIRFDTYQAKWIREQTWHPSQTLHELADGALLFEAEVSGLREIKQWVLGFGCHAEVLEPLELREDIRREIVRMSEIYDLNNIKNQYDSR